MRRIFTVAGWIVDANGTYHLLDGYPKKFDSKNYGDDTDKTLQRAKGDFYDQISGMCKVDTRMLQTMVIMDENGAMMEDPFTIGSLYIPGENGD